MRFIILWVIILNKLRYKCLILDHDDTVVNSTASIHHPAFVASLKHLRPDVTLNFDEYMQMYCSIGMEKYCRDILNFSDEERKYEYVNWLKYVDDNIPKPFEGIPQIIEKQKELGGYVCVVSHSIKENIIRDYKKNNLVAPDLVYGGELPEDKRKPNIYPVTQIMEKLGLHSNELVIIDDLPIGYNMAKASGVDFIGACWSHNVPSIRSFMLENCEKSFFSPYELYKYLFCESKDILENCFTSDTVIENVDNCI